MKWKLHYCCSPSAMHRQAELQDIIPTVLSGSCWVLFWGTLLCENTQNQNNSQRSVYVQNKGRNVKDESNHFSFLCLHFPALWKLISLFLQPQSHCIHCSAPRAGTLLPIISRSLFFQKCRTCCNKTFHILGKIQGFKMFRSEVRMESQNCTPFSNP